MSYRVVFSPEAEEQIQRLEDYIAEAASPDVARAYLNRLVGACISLGAGPYRGTSRDDIRPGLRSTGFERRVIIYFFVGADTVTIAELLYAGRQLSSRWTAPTA